MLQATHTVANELSAAGYAWLQQAESNALKRDPIDVLMDAERIEQIAWGCLNDFVCSKETPSSQREAISPVLAAVDTSYWLKHQLIGLIKLQAAEGVIVANLLVSSATRRLVAVLRGSPICN